MIAVDATAKVHNLQLTLSTNLSLSVTTTLELTRDAEAKIKLVKDEFKQFGSHKLLIKGDIQLTSSEYSQLKTSFETIDSFISFVNQNAKQTTTGSDGGPHYQTAQDAPKVVSSHQTGRHRGSKGTKTNCRGFSQAQRCVGGCLLSTSPNKFQGRVPPKLKSSDEFNHFHVL